MKTQAMKDDVASHGSNGASAHVRALLLAYVWPPAGGVGAQRVLKLAKFLPEHGVTPSVLTVSNPSVPLVDHSLSRNVSADLEILRARTLEPGYQTKSVVWQASHSQAGKSRGRRLRDRALGLARHTLVPDPQVLWQPGAMRVLATRLASPRADDIVFITAPPFSSFMSGALARLWRGTAVVLDYRDEWSTIRERYEMKGGLSARIGPWLERALVSCADAITVATESFREHLLESFPFLDPSRVHFIPNGYDPDDFPADLPDPPTDRLVVTYAGTVFTLTSASGLLAGIRLLHERSPALAERLHVRFIGRIVDTEAKAFEGMERFGVERTGFLPKDQVMRALAASHLTLVTLARLPGNERIYPAKTFELMYLGRPMLVLYPTGVLTAMVERHGAGRVLPPDDPPRVAAYLAEQLQAFVAGQLPLRAPVAGLERYHRRAQAGEFAEVFRSATARARRRAS